MLQVLVQGTTMILTLSNLVVLALGVIIGIMIGAIPGLNATLGVALLTPFTFTMPSHTAISFLLGLYVAAIYGGSISAILIGVPGTPAATCTLMDGFELGKKGQGLKAMQMALTASVVGSVISGLALAFGAPSLARVAMKFGPAEYTALAVFGLTVITSVSGKSLAKGLTMAGLGLVLASVGIDPISGTERFTFGSVELLKGISFVPLLVGMFALAQVFENIVAGDNGTVFDGSVLTESLRLKEILASAKTIVRGSVIGVVIGAIPGAGPVIASFLSYNEAKRASKNPELYGTGYLDGVAAPESANNAVCGASLIPLLTLGIPGSTAAAALLGALLIHGLTPGPQIFQEQGPALYAVFVGYQIACLLLFLLAWPLLRAAGLILKIPGRMLTAVIVAVCFVGAYANGNSIVDVFVMLGAGMLGYVLKKYDYPPVPLILAMVLGPMAENSMRQTLLASNGNAVVFLTRPISALVFLLAALSLLWPFLRNRTAARGVR